MEIVNNCSDGVNTQRQISETGRESEIVEDAATETNVDVQENPAYNFRANNASVECGDGEEYEVAMYGFTNIPIEQNPAYKVHSTGRLDEVSESGQYELVIPTESAANVIVQQNQAYNIITTQPTTDRSYEEIPEKTTEQFYEEIPVQQNHLTQVPEEVTTQAPKKVTTPALPLKAICSFWQGKAEIAIRITNLALGAVIFLLLFAIIVLYFILAVLYLFRACSVIAAIKRKRDHRNGSMALTQKT